MRIFFPECQHLRSHPHHPGKAYEVDADGGDVRLGVRVVGESQQQTGLADTGVSDEEELEEVVVSRVVY